MDTTTTADTGFVLRFKALSSSGRSRSFPCDAHGQVHLDSLGEQTLCDYLYARAVVGLELARPVVSRPQALR